jgi:hypothetical protein
VRRLNNPQDMRDIAKMSRFVDGKCAVPVDNFLAPK